MKAILSRAAENVGLVWNPSLRPDPSRLDEWFHGRGRALFCFCSTAGLAASGTQNISKGGVSSVSGSREEESVGPCIT